MCTGAKPPYPTYSTIVTGSSTVHPMKESLYFKFKITMTEIWVYVIKWPSNIHSGAALANYIIL